jgi:hypothetical protein
MPEQQVAFARKQDRGMVPNRRVFECALRNGCFERISQNCAKNLSVDALGLMPRAKSRFPSH